jgi:hypothetical protein
MKTIQTVLDPSWREPGCAGHTTRDFTVESTILAPSVNLPASAYIEQIDNHYLNVGYLIFPGTDAGSMPTKFSVAANVYPGGNGRVRLYDPSTAKTVAIIENIINTGIGILSTTTFNDVPAGESILQIQILSDGIHWLRYYTGELK